jgi:hypothetical protein
MAAIAWDAKVTLDAVAPKYGQGEETRYILPTLPGHDECLKPLMMCFSVFRSLRATIRASGSNLCRLIVLRWPSP